jgi:hypothetical protein
VDLGRAYIGVAPGFANGADLLHPKLGDFACVGPSLLEFDVLPGDLAEGPVEHRYIVLEPKAQVGVLVVGPLARRLDAGGLEGNRLVAISPRPLDAAILVAMRHVRPPEDDQPRLHLLLVGHERHHALAFCAGSVQIGGLSPCFAVPVQDLCGRIESQIQSIIYILSNIVHPAKVGIQGVFVSTQRTS